MLEELTGRRVALRHRIAPDDSPGPRFSDAVGELAADGPDVVIVHTRSGPVRVARDAVVAVREVPAAPRRRPSWTAVERLELVRAAAWPAPTRQDLGRWRLRAASGYSMRANSALALGDPGMPVEHALAEVVRFAEQHRIRPLVQVPVGSPWSRRILGAGWAPVGSVGEVVVLVAPAHPDDGPVPDWPAAPGPDWWSPHGPVPAADDPALRVLVPDGPDAPTLGFGLLRAVDGTPAAAVRAAVVDEHLYLARLAVRPDLRSRGLGGRLTRHALAWGCAHGARHAVLDVTADNDAARSLYARLGWTEHHRYHYLAPGPRRPDRSPL